MAGLYALPRPSQPRTTLNVGRIEGGGSVNSIAAEASLLLDLRSLDPDELAKLDRAALNVLHEAARATGVQLDTERVGDRPGGLLNSDALLELARAASNKAGLSLHLAASSTDANAAVPYNLPALSLGVYSGGNAHRLDEWVDPTSHVQGLALLKDFVQRYQQNPL